MGVDQKRPLVGFALVAVLCAILMTVSVGRGWADFVQPGKPIAAAAFGGHVDRAPAPTSQPSARADSAEIAIPVELSAQPLGVAVGSPVARKSAGSAESQTAAVQDATRASRADRTAEKSDRKADRQAAKAQRQAEKAVVRAQRQAEKAVVRAQRQAEKAAVRAQRQAEKAAEKAADEAARSAAKAARAAEGLVAMLTRTADKTAEKAAEKAARKG